MKLGWGFVKRPFSVVQNQREFRKLWIGNGVSRLGTYITRLALPLTAAVTLRASPVEMGVLAAAATLPNLLFGLPVGVIVDRVSRRLILVVADIGNALLLFSIPAAVWLDALRLEQLYVVAFLTGALDLFFDIAATSLVPVILGREHLADGNAALNINDQVAKVGGPSVAGVLIGILTAPVAIVVDAISFLVSAGFSAAVRLSETPAIDGAEGGGWWADIMQGIRMVLHDPILRSIVGASILGTLAGAVQAPLLILFFARDLDLSAAMIGIVFSVSGAASIPGSFLARPAAAWLGEGRATAAGTLAASLGMLLLPLADGPTPVVFAVLILAQLLIGLGIPVYAINQITIRQLAVPHQFQGRTNATRRFFMFGAAPLGAMISGYLGESVGLRPTLLVGGLLMGLALLWTYRSPLWSLRETV